MLGGQAAIAHAAQSQGEPRPRRCASWGRGGQAACQCTPPHYVTGTTQCSRVASGWGSSKDEKRQWLGKHGWEALHVPALFFLRASSTCQQACHHVLTVWVLLRTCRGCHTNTTTAKCCNPVKRNCSTSFTNVCARSFMAPGGCSFHLVYKPGLPPRLGAQGTHETNWSQWLVRTSYKTFLC